MGALQTILRKISDENTLACIITREPGYIGASDKKIVKQLYGEGNDFRSIGELAAQIHQLNTIYELSNDFEYKSMILGWDPDKSRFFVKEKIKNDAPESSILEFVRQLPFLMAICYCIALIITNLR